MPRVSLPNGETAEFPDTMAPADIESVLQRQFPASKPDTDSPFVGAVKDTFGLTDRPGKRTVLDVLARPEGVLEHAASLATTAPAIALGGAGAGAMAARTGLPLLTKAAPFLGRMLTSGGIGAGEAAARGDDPTTGGLVNAGVTAGTEGALSLLTQGRIPFLPKSITAGLKDLGSPARAFEHARTAVVQALDDIAAKLPGIKFIVPALGNTKMTPEEVGKILSTATGKTYETGRLQLKDAITRAEKIYREMRAASLGVPVGRDLGLNAGQEFAKFTKPARFDPGVVYRGAEGLRRGLESTAPGLDALATEDAEMLGMPGVPLGAIAAGGLWGAGKKWIPGLR